jgi:hypothetical protein
MRELQSQQETNIDFKNAKDEDLAYDSNGNRLLVQKFDCDILTKASNKNRLKFKEYFNTLSIQTSEIQKKIKEWSA